MKINSNIQAQIANNILKSNESKYSKSTERLSSGYRLNHAEDSPAGMAITNKMHAQIKSLEKATQNSSNAISVIQTAEGAISEIQEMVQRMNELSIKASNGTMTQSDRDAIQMEMKQLSSEIERIAADTEYNTQNLLGGEQSLKGYTDNNSVEVAGYDYDFPEDKYSFSISGTSLSLKDSSGKELIGTETTHTIIQEKSIVGGVEVVTGGKVTVTRRDGSSIDLFYNSDPANANVDISGIGGMKIQVGSSEGQEIKLVIPTFSLRNMGLKNVDCSTEEGAKNAMDQVKYALSFVSKARSSLGAYQNRLEATVSSLDIAVENLNQSYSTIKDVNMAEEMVNYTTLQVLVQAGTSMLTQANEQPQQALQLLQ